MTSRDVIVIAAVLACAPACYTGAPANRDVAAAWRGHARAELVDRWGAPARTTPIEGDAEALVYAHDVRHVELPEFAVVAPHAHADVAVPGGTLHADVVGLGAAVRPGLVWHSTTTAVAVVDPATATIARVDGATLRWGPPNDANLHWGTIYGLHVGMGRLDATSTPLPSGGAYLGGMLSPTLGLVGTFDLAAGTGDRGGAMGFAWGMAAQYWPLTRLWVRAGPAMLLAFDPGFANPALHPGGTAAASYAFVKVGRFVVDLRADVAAGPSVAFGSVGVGVAVD